MLNVLVQRILLVVDGGDGASGGAIRLFRGPFDLVGQLAPGILAIVHGDHTFQGNVPLEGQDLLRLHVGDALDIGKGNVVFVFSVHPNLQRVRVVDIQQEGIIAPGVVRAVFGLYRDGIYIPIAGGIRICGFVGHFDLVQQIASGKSAVAAGPRVLHRCDHLCALCDQHFKLARMRGVAVEVLDFPAYVHRPLGIGDIVAVQLVKGDDRRF